MATEWQLMRKHAIRAQPNAVLVVMLPDQLPDIVNAIYENGRYLINVRNGPSLSVNIYGHVSLYRTGEMVFDVMNKYGWT